MAAADFEVVEIVGWGDLDRARAFFRVRIGVGDDRDRSADQRQDCPLADQRAVHRVIGMHRHGGVAEHRLGSRGGDDDGLAGFALDRVAQIPKRSLDLAVFHFQIRDRRLQLRIPVHQPAVAVDQAFFVKRDKGLLHRGGQTVVHGEALARPVERRAEAAQLARDGAAGFRLPLPHALDERVAAQIPAVFAFFRQQPFHHHLCGDAGVIGARLPQRVATLHPAPADQRILDGERQRVAHVQAAGDVRRRDHDGEGRRVRVWVAGEAAGVFPSFIQACLDLGRCEPAIECH